MIKLSMIFWALFLGSVAFAESVVPTRTIRADAEIGAKDVTLKEVSNPSAYTRLADVIGQEARVTLYAGRPILFDDIGPPAVVARNQIVLLQYNSAGLRIVTEGRSLQRGGVGDRIRIMNLDSRATLFGQVQEDGTINVSK